MCKVYIHRFSYKKQNLLKDGGIIMKRKAVALILIVQILALSLFTGCGKEKLTQDPGTMSSEMTGDQIEFIKKFELDAKDISKHFTNLIVNTPDGLELIGKIVARNNIIKTFIAHKLMTFYVVYLPFIVPLHLAIWL